jgi:hypothetical protein
MAALPQPDLIPVGVSKSFGEHGPMYEVLGSAPRGQKAKWSQYASFTVGKSWTTL